MFAMVGADCGAAAAEREGEERETGDTEEERD